MDEEGSITIRDRIKDMINVKGYKVFSIEIEEKLREHPVVQHCAVLPIPDPENPGSEWVMLFVQSLNPEEGGKNLIEKLESFCREQLSPYKVPKIIEITQNIPLTPIGKVDKKGLKN